MKPKQTTPPPLRTNCYLVITTYAATSKIFQTRHEAEQYYQSQAAPKSLFQFDAKGVATMINFASGGRY